MSLGGVFVAPTGGFCYGYMGDEGAVRGRNLSDPGLLWVLVIEKIELPKRLWFWYGEIFLKPVWVVIIEHHHFLIHTSNYVAYDR